MLSFKKRAKIRRVQYFKCPACGRRLRVRFNSSPPTARWVRCCRKFLCEPMVTRW